MSTLISEETTEEPVVGRAHVHSMELAKRNCSLWNIHYSNNRNQPWKHPTYVCASGGSHRGSD